MPAVSKSQQRLMGMAHAYNKGELPNASKEVKQLAKSMKKKDLKDFAKTKHKGLPEKKRKKKKRSKKSEIIVYLTKLGNQLDQQGLTEIADLADSILFKLAAFEEEGGEDSFRIYPDKPSTKSEPRPESDEELEMLPDTELPKVKPYREVNKYWVKAIFKDGTETLLNLDPETIQFMNRYLDATQGRGKKSAIPEEGPYTFNQIPAIVSLFLTFYKQNSEIQIDKETQKQIAERMLDLPPQDLPLIGLLDHLEIARFDPAGVFEGNPVGEPVANYYLNGELELLVPEEELGAIQPLELLLDKNPKQELSELSDLTQKHKFHNFPYSDPDDPDRTSRYKADEEKHFDRWKRRYEEAQRRFLERRYPPDLYSGDSSREIPYGEEIEDFEENEDNQAF